MTLSDNLRLLDMIEEQPHAYSWPDFEWMDNETILRLAMNHDAIDRLDGEARHDLIRELAFRLDNYLNGDEDQDS